MLPEGWTSYPNSVAIGMWFNMSSQHLTATIVKINVSFRANVLQNDTRHTHA
jgi:hypothetical protein